MEYNIELKPFVEKDGVKYKVIEITDLALHTTKKSPTALVGRKVQQAFEKNQPDRIYSPINTSPPHGDGSMILEMLKMDADFVRMVHEEEAKGFKILLSFPKGGIPVYAGKDTIEFMESKNGKRIIRKLAKDKKKE